MRLFSPPVFLQCTAPAIISCHRPIQTFHNGSVAPVDRSAHRIPVILIGTVLHFIQNIITEPFIRLVYSAISNLVIKIIRTIGIKCRQSPRCIIGILHGIYIILQMVLLLNIGIQCKTHLQILHEINIQINHRSHTVCLRCLGHTILMVIPQRHIITDIFRTT